MGREVRMVPPGWEHPKDDDEDFLPLMKGPYSKRVKKWDEDAAKWAEGLRDDWNGGWIEIDPEDRKYTFAEWDGERPVKEHYMPEWPAEEATMMVMYENTTEGTPISPQFRTPGELARWLADNNASAIGLQGASYESWLGMCKRGWAPSMMVIGDQVISGVEGMASEPIDNPLDQT